MAYQWSIVLGGETAVAPSSKDLAALASACCASAKSAGFEPRKARCAVSGAEDVLEPVELDRGPAPVTGPSGPSVAGLG